MSKNSTTVELKDQKRICKKCKHEFIFEKGEQEYFLEKLLPAPNHCPPCRKAKKRIDLAKSYGKSGPKASYVTMTEYVRMEIIELSLNRGLEYGLDKKAEGKKEQKKKK